MIGAVQTPHTVSWPIPDNKAVQHTNQVWLAEPTGDWDGMSHGARLIMGRGLLLHPCDHWRNELLCAGGYRFFSNFGETRCGRKQHCYFPQDV